MEKAARYSEERFLLGLDPVAWGTTCLFDEAPRSKPSRQLPELRALWGWGPGAGGLCSDPCAVRGVRKGLGAQTWHGPLL